MRTAGGCASGPAGCPSAPPSDASVPSCSSRRSQCRRRAWCSWTTKRASAGSAALATLSGGGSGVAVKSRLRSYADSGSRSLMARTTDVRRRGRRVWCIRQWTLGPSPWMIRMATCSSCSCAVNTTSTRLRRCAIVSTRLSAAPRLGRARGRARRPVLRDLPGLVDPRRAARGAPPGAGARPRLRRMPRRAAGAGRSAHPRDHRPRAGLPRRPLAARRRWRPRAPRPRTPHDRRARSFAWTSRRDRRVSGSSARRSSASRTGWRSTAPCCPTPRWRSPRPARTPSSTPTTTTGRPARRRDVRRRRRADGRRARPRRRHPAARQPRRARPRSGSACR